MVGREKVREFAAAVADDHPAHSDVEAAKELGYPTVIASLTFIAVAGRRVQLEMFKHFDVGVNLARVIHRDQKLKFHRPIVVGDELYFDSYLDSVTESHGTIISELRSEVTDGDGKPVVTIGGDDDRRGHQHRGNRSAGGRDRSRMGMDLARANPSGSASAPGRNPQPKNMFRRLASS